MAQAAPSLEERRKQERVGPSKLADILFDAFYTAAVGGSVVALFFLVVDLAMGRGALYTPSLLGSVTFAGAEPESVTQVRLDMASYFTIVHFALFGWIGLAMSVLVHTVEVYSPHPRGAFLGLFLILEGSFLLGANLFAPGVVATIGFGRIVAANLLAAAAMTAFMIRSHDPEKWDRLVHGKPVI